MAVGIKAAIVEAAAVEAAEVGVVEAVGKGIGAALIPGLFIFSLVFSSLGFVFFVLTRLRFFFFNQLWKSELCETS